MMLSIIITGACIMLEHDVLVKELLSANQLNYL